MGVALENAPVAPGPGAMVEFPAGFEEFSDEDSAHTDDMLVKAPPGTLTRLRQDFSIMDARGTIRNHSRTQSEFCSSVGVSIFNHPDVIKISKSKLEYVEFLKSRGLLDEFNSFQLNQSKLHARTVNDMGFVEQPTLESLAQKIGVREGILRIGDSNNGAGSNADVPKTWSSIVVLKITQNSSSAPEPSLSYNADGSANLSPPKYFLLAG